MLARFDDFDSTFAVFDSLLDRFAYDYARAENADVSPQAWRRLSVREKDSALEVSLDVPGLNENDIGVAIHDGVLHIRGERKSVDAAEAKLVRAAGLKFEKSFTLPYKIDVDGATASVKDGVLTIGLPKAAEAKPRAIAVTGKVA